MKNSLILNIFSILLVSACTGIFGYFVGENLTEKKIYIFNEDEAAASLYRTLYVLEKINSGDLNDAKRNLEATTAPQLDWIIDYGNFSDKKGEKFRCDLLKKLVAYREENKLFHGSNWDFLWKNPEMREAEDRRVKFLAQTAPKLCDWNTNK